MGSKVTCSTCGKVWETNKEYLADTKKCGKQTCPLLAPRQAVRPPAASKTKEKKGLTVSVSTGTIPDPMTEKDRLEQAHYWLQVPKVIVVEVKRAR